MTATRRIIVPVFIFLFALVLGWGIILQFQPAHTTVANYSFNLGYALFYALGAALGIIGAFYVTTNISMGKAFLYLGLAQLSYTIGLCIWAYYNLVAKVPVPYPSAADIFFVLFYPLMAIGCWYFLTMVATQIHMQYVLEMLGIFFVSAIVIVGFLNVPDTTSTLSAFTKIINLWYPLGDCLLITVSYLIFRAGKGKFQTGILILILGLLVQVFADLIFSYRTGANIYWNGDISDILFAVSGGTISFGIITLFYDFIASGQTANE